MEEAVANAVSQPLSADNLATLLQNTDAFLFDCDGVIWKGDKLIDGVAETLDVLRSMGKKLVFVTNNSSKSRKKYSEKFQNVGLNVREDEIFCSSFAGAMYLKSINFPRDKKVYVIGREGILEELQLAGFTGIGGPEDAKKSIELKENCFFEHDKSVGAVIVGLDYYINYYKLQYATLCIRENPGCLFIATNRDSIGNLTDLQEWPGAGCMVAAVCGSTEREPVVVGKPSTFIMDYLLDRLFTRDLDGVLKQNFQVHYGLSLWARQSLNHLKRDQEIRVERFKLDTSKMCMVGDRLDTDILFGKNAGCKTLLVFSGVTKPSALQDPANGIFPDYYTNQVSDILTTLKR